MRLPAIFLPLALLAPPVAADDPPVYDRNYLEQCQEEREHPSVCIGLWANDCMAQPDRGSAAGMLICLEAERLFWEGQMDSAYRALLQRYDITTFDLDMPPMPAALSNMQDDWRNWRNELCGFEALQYWGGVSANIVELRCHMEMTAEQYFRLEDFYFGM